MIFCRAMERFVSSEMVVQGFVSPKTFMKSSCGSEIVSVEL